MKSWVGHCSFPMTPQFTGIWRPRRHMATRHSLQSDAYMYIGSERLVIWIDMYTVRYDVDNEFHSHGTVYDATCLTVLRYRCFTRRQLAVNFCNQLSALRVNDASLVAFSSLSWLMYSLPPTTLCFSSKCLFVVHCAIQVADLVADLRVRVVCARARPLGSRG